MAYFSSHIFKIHRFSFLSTTRLNTYLINSPKESSVRKKQKQKEFSNVIKSTRTTLRMESQNKDDKEVMSLWLKHTDNKQLVQKYSDAAHILATQYWKSEERDNRITWAYTSLRKYFYDGLQRDKLKEETIRASHLMDPTSLKDFNDKARAILKRYKEGNKLKILDVGSCYNPFGKFDDLEVTPIDLHPAIPEVHRCDFVDLKITDGEDKLEYISNPAEERPKNENKSIYNTEFFSHGHIWNKLNVLLNRVLKSVLNIDIPKKEISQIDNNGPKKKMKRNETHEIKETNWDSCKMDFNASIEKPFEENKSFFGNNSEKLSVNKDVDSISELKAASYDAVVFSLVLDCIPTAKLRYECCLKAYKLLKPSGILCIIYPGKRSPLKTKCFLLMKCTLAFMGFERIEVKKRPFFQGMIFRKNLSPDFLIEDAKRDLNSLGSEYSKIFPNLDWESLRYSVYDTYDINDLKTEENNTDKEKHLYI